MPTKNSIGQLVNSLCMTKRSLQILLITRPDEDSERMSSDEYGQPLTREINTSLKETELSDELML